jgi:hypothetical protein
MHTCERSAVVSPLRWVMGAIPAFFFLIGFFHRAAPGVIARDLMPAFEATGTTVGVPAGGVLAAALTPGPMGAVLDTRWAEALVDGGRYPVEAYRDGFAVCAAQDPA